MLAAIAKAVDAATIGGGQVIVVDADNEGHIPFYTECGFLPSGVAGCLRLYTKLATAEQESAPERRIRTANYVTAQTPEAVAKPSEDTP